MIKNNFTQSIFVLAFVFTSCTFDGIPAPETGGPDPEPWYVMSRDSVAVGDYLSITVGTSGEVAYRAVQALHESKGVAYLNMVSNHTSDIHSLENRLPLYSYILLDEQTGTATGVQFTIEDGVVKHIYLNSGKKLSRWPEKGKPSVREGDNVGELYGKLAAISKKSSYSKKFERISLNTKDLARPFDPITAHLPNWYFSYLTEEGHLEIVEIHLKAGKVRHLIVTRQTNDRRDLHGLAE